MPRDTGKGGVLVLPCCAGRQELLEVLRGQWVGHLVVDFRDLNLPARIRQAYRQFQPVGIVEHGSDEGKDLHGGGGRFAFPDASIDNGLYVGWPDSVGRLWAGGLLDVVSPALKVGLVGAFP